MNALRFSTWDVVGPLAQSTGSFWMPPRSSTVAPLVDHVFYVILGVVAVFFVAVVACMALFVLLYRKRPGHEAKPSPTHHTGLEIFWTAVPVVIVIVIFVMSFRVFMQMYTVPNDAYEIRVVAQKWTWLFQYPNGASDENLHVPAGRPVRLVMESRDVIHSLFIPDFRVKMDCVPGRYTTTWFKADEPGDHVLLCAEYCGKAHSDMLARVIVHPEGEYEQWLADALDIFKDRTPAEAGKDVFTRRGCIQCHSIDGTARTGPTLLGAYGAQHKMKDGSEVTVDDNYIRESILEPQAKIRDGFRPAMSPYKGLITDDEIYALIEFIKTLEK